MDYKKAVLEAKKEAEAYKNETANRLRSHGRAMTAGMRIPHHGLSRGQDRGRRLMRAMAIPHHGLAMSRMRARPHGMHGEMRSDRQMNSEHSRGRTANTQSSPTSLHQGRESDIVGESKEKPSSSSSRTHLKFADSDDSGEDEHSHIMKKKKAESASAPHSQIKGTAQISKSKEEK
mmetsp:Transcript_6901/g.17444  ORF Transcript_6901/g.17444 Transcript_6901/m.17444 type:complete len:176 (+) Transcript_6901:137-664(+)